MILPVGVKKQNIMVITKVDENGKFVTKKLLDVMYGPLTDPEEQLAKDGWQRKV